MSRELHIVLVGYDATLFQVKGWDTHHRHLAYAAEIARQRPGSFTSVLIMTQEPVSIESHPNAAFIPVKGRGLLLRWNLLQTLFKLHRQRPIDVLSPQTIFDDAWICLLIAIFIGARIIAQVHFDLFASEAVAENLGVGWRGRLRYAIGMRLLPGYYRVRVVGQGLQGRLVARGLSPERMAVVPVPVTMSGAGDRAGSSVPVVLFVGRLVYQKNLGEWLHVAQCIFERHPDATFVLAGDGPEREQLESLAQSLGIPAQFLGFVAYDELPALYARATVLLLTSHYEGFGRVAVEAGLYRLPVVAPHITGIEDIIIDNVTGFLHKPGDRAGLANSVVRLLSHPTLAQTMGQAAYNQVRQLFDPERLTQQIASLLISAARE